MKAVAIILLFFMVMFLTILGGAYFDNGFYGWNKGRDNFKLMIRGALMLLGAFLSLYVFIWLLDH